MANAQETILPRLPSPGAIAHRIGPVGAERDAIRVERFQIDLAVTVGRRRAAHIRPDRSHLRGQCPQHGGAEREGHDIRLVLRIPAAPTGSTAVHHPVVLVHRVAGGPRAGDAAMARHHTGRVQQSILEILEMEIGVRRGDQRTVIGPRIGRDRQSLREDSDAITRRGDHFGRGRPLPARHGDIGRNIQEYGVGPDQRSHQPARARYICDGSHCLPPFPDNPCAQLLGY